MNIKLQWKVVRNTIFVLFAFYVRWQKHTASLFLWFLALKNFAWKCSFGGAQTSIQTQLFITILNAKLEAIVCRSSFWLRIGKPHLVLVCWCASMCIKLYYAYSGKDLGSLQCISGCWVVLLWLNLLNNTNVQIEDGNTQSSSGLEQGCALFCFMCWCLEVGESMYILVLWSRM